MLLRGGDAPGYRVEDQAAGLRLRQRHRAKQWRHELTHLAPALIEQLVVNDRRA